MSHHVHPHLLARRVGVTLIGCGGNGSQMLTGLAQLNHAIVALGHPGLQVTAYDPDIVSEANMGRQLFSPADVGQNKANVLVHRVNAFFGVRWEAKPKLFAADDRKQLIIACVDSTRARKSISVELERKPSQAPIYFMDLGNRAADGQVVLGEWRAGAFDTEAPRPAGHVPLSNPFDMLPELLDLDLAGDDAPSCGLAEALERQELFVNRAISTPALAILWEMFRHGQLSWHGAFVNLRTGNTRPMNVRAA